MSETAQASPLGARPTSEKPWPVHVVSQKIKEWIDRLGPVWVEGQVIQYDVRGSAAYLVLRDTDVDASLRVTLFHDVLQTLPGPIAPGSRVILGAKTTFWLKNGSLQLQANSLREVGIGELLARVEELKRRLAEEGLFDAERKIPLPFAPLGIGLICGREAKAKDDVLNNTLRRWPGVTFAIREVAVQGPSCVPQVSAAIAELDADPGVEVIVIARGGGAVEDLLPFSNETLLRAAAACATPLVSAIGHEADSPLLDLVADYRASTPTDAAKRIVPDLGEEVTHLTRAAARLDDLFGRRLESEQQRLSLLLSRPALANPAGIVETRQAEIDSAAQRSTEILTRRLDNALAEITAMSAQIKALSPQATLDRGYAVVRGGENNAIIRSPKQSPSGSPLVIQVARGVFTATAD